MLLGGSDHPLDHVPLAVERPVVDERAAPPPLLVPLRRDHRPDAFPAQPVPDPVGDRIEWTYLATGARVSKAVISGNKLAERTD